MFDRKSSPGQCRVFVGAMLFRIAWRTTPQQLRDQTLIGYGLDAGVPATMVRFLRGSEQSEPCVREMQDDRHAGYHSSVTAESVTPAAIPQVFAIPTGYALITAIINATQAQASAIMLLLSEIMVGSAASKASR